MAEIPLAGQQSALRRLLLNRPFHSTCCWRLLEALLAAPALVGGPTPQLKDGSQGCGIRRPAHCAAWGRQPLKRRLKHVLPPVLLSAAWSVPRVTCFVLVLSTSNPQSPVSASRDRRTGRRNSIDSTLAVHTQGHCVPEQQACPLAPPSTAVVLCPTGEVCCPNTHQCVPSKRVCYAKTSTSVKYLCCPPNQICCTGAGPVMPDSKFVCIRAPACPVVKIRQTMQQRSTQAGRPGLHSSRYSVSSKTPYRQTRIQNNAYSPWLPFRRHMYFLPSHKKQERGTSLLQYLARNRPCMQLFP
eukprot:SM000248S08312  [mRNA]  locus=s248:102578:105913:- [translate_table: standard]